MKIAATLLTLMTLLGYRNTNNYNIVVYANETCKDQVDGFPCEDGNQCTLNDTCVNGSCSPGEGLQIKSVDTTYKHGSLIVDYTIDATTMATPNVQLIFEYAGIEPALSITTFEAVIHEDNLCVGPVIGKTDNARVATQSTQITPYPFDVVVLTADTDTTNASKSEPVLQLYTPFTNFTNPFWKMDIPRCENVDGVCGVLEFCITFQSFLCNRLVDFVDVNVQINIGGLCPYDCRTLEEELTCLEKNVYSKQDASIEKQMDYIFQCTLCDDDDYDSDTNVDMEDPDGDMEDSDGGTEDSDNDTTSFNINSVITDGVPIKACMTLQEYFTRNNNACILEVRKLDMIIISVTTATNPIRYGILPQENDLNLTANGVEYNNADMTATVEFFPPLLKDDIEELAMEEDVYAYFDGLVVLGYNCYCDGSCSLDSRRHLDIDEEDDENNVILFTFKGNEFFLAGPLPEPDESQQSNACNGLLNSGIGIFNFCPFQWIYASVSWIITQLLTSF